MIRFIKSLPAAFSRSASAKLPSPRVVFLNEFRAISQPIVGGGSVPQARLLVTPSAGEVEVHFTSSSRNFHIRSGNKLILDWIVARTPRQGHGNEAMQMLGEIADRHGVEICMFMEPLAHEALSMDELEMWASNHGFEPYNNPTGLYWREPRTVNAGALRAAP